MPEIDPLFRVLAGALALGLLIGLERGWRQRDLADGQRVIGFRTFALIGLAGGVAALLPPAIAAAIGAGVAVVLALGYAAMLRRQASLSVTTTIMGFLTFALGYLAATGMVVQAFAAAAVSIAVLVSRGKLHGLLKGMSAAEVEAVARFALVALVILPVLPDADYGPYGAWNPRHIWMVVVIVLGFSFAGYIAARRFGSGRGLLVTAIFGAFVSSTAVTLTYARRLREGGGSDGALIAGISLASLVMFIRVQVLTALLAPFASWSLAIAMLPALAVALGMAGLSLWRARGEQGAEAVALGNPMDFRPALFLAGLLAILSVVARWALEQFGHEGIALLLGITGMMDVDASVVTLAGLPTGAIDGWTAGLVLSAPILANTLIKAMMALVGAGGRKGVAAATPLFAAVLASLGGIAAAAWLT